MSKQYRLMFTPLRVGSVTVPNRIVFTAHLTNLGEDNLPGERLAYYYAARARGGSGLIITEEQSVHPSDRAYEKLIAAYERSVIPRYRVITGMVHQYGAKIFAQLSHNGSQGASLHTRRPLWAPSPVPDPLFKEVPKEMTRYDIVQLIEHFARAAGHVRDGGFDGLELQCSHSSLMRQFLSPLTNLRRDAYGGALDNRLRLLLQTAGAVRRTVGRDFVVGVRLSGEEFVDGGLKLADTVAIAGKIEESGLFDYINTSTGVATHALYLVEGNMCMPPGYNVYASSAVKRAVRLPVIAAGRIKDPAQVEQILRDGHADLVGMVRAQVADPDIVHKSRQGMTEIIRTCLSCNQDCIGRVGLNEDIGCVQNPAVGRERSWGTLPPATKPRRVLVVGGGPGGMEAAKTAALRGHRVTLWEKEAELGGQVKYACRLPHRAEFGDMVRNLLRELKDAGATIETGIAATVQQVLAASPDVVVVATGSLPQKLSLPGCDQENVYTVWQVLAENAPPGERVLIVDQLGFHPSAGVAELLADRGKKVEIVSPALYVGQGLGRTLDLEMWYRRARQKGIALTPNVSLLAVEGNLVRGVHNYGGREVTWPGVDSVVLAVPNRADDELYFALIGKIPRLYRIGDCVAPRRVDAAVRDGHRVARSI